MQITQTDNISNFGIYSVATSSYIAPITTFNLTFISGSGSFNTNRVHAISWVEFGATGSQGPQGVQGSVATFTYSYTLYVDPSGDDSTAIIGRIDKPWKNVGKAIEILETAHLHDYTVLVSPGIYYENKQWYFSGNCSGTFVKLSGGVKINFGAGGTVSYALGNTSSSGNADYAIKVVDTAIVTICGDENSFGDIGAKIISNFIVTNSGNPAPNIGITGMVNFKLSNVDIVNLKTSTYAYNIYTTGVMDNSKIQYKNCTFLTDGPNPNWEQDKYSSYYADTLAIDCAWVTNDTVTHYSVSNWDLRGCNNAGVDYISFYIARNRFSVLKTNTTGFDGHIITDDAGYNVNIWMTWDSNWFYSKASFSPYYMWLETVGSGRSYLDCLGNSIGNINDISAGAISITIGALSIGAINTNENMY